MKLPLIYRFPVAVGGLLAFALAEGCDRSEAPPPNKVDIEIHDPASGKGIEIKVPANQREAHIDIKH